MTQCINSTAPTELSYATIGISSLLLVITVPANLLVCLAIIVDPNRQLRTQFNCFTFNLALADLILGCFVEPLMIYAHVAEVQASNQGHKESLVIRNVCLTPYFTAATASILTIAALACERCLAIRSPLLYRDFFNVKLTVIVSGTIWIVAISLGASVLIFMYALESFIVINIGVLFTGVLICSASCCIYTSLNKSLKQWRQKGVTPKKDTLAQAKLTNTLALMVGALIVCYVPACSMAYYVYFCTSCDCEVVEYFEDAQIWLVQLNSAIDPYVYAVRSGPFRNAIWKVLERAWKRGRGVKTRLQGNKDQRREKNQARINYGALSASVN